MAAQQLVRKFHRVHVPLTFWQDTGHSCDIKATQRLVGHICKTSVREVLAAPAQNIPKCSTQSPPSHVVRVLRAVDLFGMPKCHL